VEISERPLGGFLLATEVDVSDTSEFGIAQIDNVAPTARPAREMKQNTSDKGWFEMQTGFSSLQGLFPGCVGRSPISLSAVNGLSK
jgi:hypothetical protein